MEETQTKERETRRAAGRQVERREEREEQSQREPESEGWAAGHRDRGLRGLSWSKASPTVCSRARSPGPMAAPTSAPQKHRPFLPSCRAGTPAGVL